MRRADLQHLLLFRQENLLLRTIHKPRLFPTELMTINFSPRTDENAQRNLLINYEQKFSNLPYHLQWTKQCSNVRITKTSAKGNYFTTVDDAELEHLGDSCRENTFPRHNAAPKMKRWTRGNTKIGPALEVAVTHHQGRYGIEIMIQSLLNDGTCSWVMIVNGINKHVTGDDQGDPRRTHYIGEKYKETCC